MLYNEALLAMSAMQPKTLHTHCCGLFSGDGENHVAREFEDFLENDDVLMKEAYELS